MISYVQKIGGGIGASDPSPDVSVSSNTTAGNFVILVIRGHGGGYVNSVSDTQGNTWVVEVATSTAATISVAYAILDTALTTSDTITCTPSASLSFAVSVYEYSGVDSVNPIHGSSSDSGLNIGTGSSGPITVTDSDVMLVSCHITTLTSVPTSHNPPAGYTMRTPVTTGGGTSVVADMTAGSTGDFDSTWTWSPKANWAVALLGLNPAPEEAEDTTSFFAFM